MLLEVGETYLTNAGNEVKIVAKCDDLKYPFIGVMYEPEPYGVHIDQFMEDGQAMSTARIARKKPKKVTVEKWVNVYTDCVSYSYNSKEEALKHRTHTNYIDTIKLTGEYEIV